MNAQLNDILFQVAEQTLENLAFLFSFPEEGPEDTGEPSVGLGVSFAGPYAGRLVMNISTAVLAELAANMLGLDEEETTRDDQYDAVAELLNVICGNLLPALSGKQVVFNITTPEILADGAAGLDGQAPEVRAATTLALGNGTCKLFLWVDGDVQPGMFLTEPTEPS